MQNLVGQGHNKIISPVEMKPYHAGLVEHNLMSKRFTNVKR